MATPPSTPSNEAYSELQLAFDTFNRELFGGSLPQVLLTLQRQPNTCGYLSADRFAKRDGAMTHELAMNPEFFAVVPLLDTLQTLVHEQVHLWQHRFGKPARGRYHNGQWADKMESIGLMPSSTGKPGGKRCGDRMSDYPIVGGRFLQVVQQLLDEEGFAISWYDRFPAVRPAAATAPTTSYALPASATQVPADHGVPTVTRAPAPETNASNRVKYSCAKCKLSVWGKPRLSIGCNTCQLTLEPASVLQAIAA